MAHTEGPWWACPPDADSGNWEVEDGYGHTATVYGDDDPAAANARLIAAAPDLLAALKRLVDYCDNHSDYDSIGAACAAIAKAEGSDE